MGHEHVNLVEVMPSGPPARELVPAEPLSDDEWLIIGTPGLVNGCAAGDHVRVHSDGTFEILRRGGNVAAHIYAAAPLPDDGLLNLRRVFTQLGGAVEWPATKRFVVITVPTTAGFQSIEPPIESFVSAHDGTDWRFGNVYGEDGAPLSWWT